MTTPDFDPKAFGPLPLEQPCAANHLFQSVRLNGQSAVRLVLFSPTGAHCTYWSPDAMLVFADQARQAARQAKQQLDLPAGGGLIVPPGSVDGQRPGP